MDAISDGLLMDPININPSLFFRRFLGTAVITQTLWNQGMFHLIVSHLSLLLHHQVYHHLSNSQCHSPTIPDHFFFFFHSWRQRRYENVGQVIIYVINTNTSESLLWFSSSRPEETRQNNTSVKRKDKTTRQLTCLN